MVLLSFEDKINFIKKTIKMLMHERDVNDVV